MKIKNRIDLLERRIIPTVESDQNMADIPDAPLNLEEWKKLCVRQLVESYGGNVDPEMKRSFEEIASKSAMLVERRIAQGQFID